MKNQVNFNSVLLLVIGALVVFTVRKLDANNTELIKVSNAQQYLIKRIDGIETKLGEVVMKDVFDLEINAYRRELEAIKKRTILKPN